MTKKTIIQNHHVSYDPPDVVTVYKGEHMLLTRLGWRKKVSRGFIYALKKWLELNENKAVELG